MIIGNQQAEDLRRCCDALEADNKRLREVLEECVKLLARTPKVTRDIYVGRDSIAWGRQAGTVCKHARSALSGEGK